MKADTRLPTAVLLGAWNPMIFHPGWMAKHLLGKNEGEAIQVTIVQNPDGKQLYYITDHIGYFADSTRLELYLNNFSEDAFEKLAEFIRKVLATLPHTPLSDYGINFAFSQQDAPDPVLEKLDSADRIDQVYTVIGQELLANINYSSGCQLNFKRVGTTTAAYFNFNYHHAIEVPNSLFDISGSYLKSLYDDSVSKLKQLYDLEIEGEIAFFPLEGHAD